MARCVALMTAFLLVLAGVTVDLSLDIPWLDQQRFGQVAVLVLVVIVWLMYPQVGTGILRRMPVSVRVGLVGFLGLGLLSTLLAPLWEWALLEWSMFLLLVALSLLLAGIWVSGGRPLNCWLAALLVSVAAVVVVKVMTGYVAALVEGVRLDTLLLFEGAFSNRRFFGQLATLFIPILAWRVGLANRYLAVWWALLVLWWMLALVSGTRGTWLALGVAHAFLWAGLGRHVWPYMRIQGLGLGLGLLAYGVLFYAVPAWMGIETGVENRLDRHFAGLSQRETIWALAWQYTWTNPWLGIGPMHFAAYPNPVAAHPHNALLQLAAEWGIPAMLVAMGVVLYGLVAFAKPLLREVDPLRLALLIALLGAGVQSMVDGVIVIPYTQTWLAILAGWALGLHFKDYSLGERPAGILATTGVRLVMLLAMAGLLWGVWPEILNRPEATATYLEQHDSLSPRYWAQGWIP